MSYESPPWGRGATFFNGGTTDATSGAQHEGHRYWFVDHDLSAPGPAKVRSNRLVQCMIVRNVSGINLLPKRIASLKASGLNFLGQVDGYATTSAAMGYPIDEWLPAAGVPQNDLFYVVVDGPAMVLTDLASGANNNITVGTVLVALTAVTSQSTTAGRVYPQDLTGATAPLGNQVQNRLGFALSAQTTTQTNSSLLIDVRKW